MPAEQVPLGAPRPSMTMWYDPGGVMPPVSWWPSSGEFETHWDWDHWTALAIPGVWRARMLISQSIAGMSIGAWRGQVAIEPLPALLAEPNPGEDRVNTIAAWVCDLLDHGNAVAQVTARDWQGVPTAMVPHRAADTEIGRLDGGGVAYRFNGGPWVPRSEVFHAKGTCLPGDVRGMGVLEAGLPTLNRISTENQYAANAFASGTPSGLLRVKDPDLQPGSVDDDAGFVTAAGIKKQWKQSVATGDVAVLSDLVDFTPLSWTPEAAQMVQARTLSLTDISGLFNLDGYWLGAPAAPMVYQNVQQAGVQLARFTLGFWITALEAEFSRLLPRGQQARFNRDSILRDELTVRAGFYSTALHDGWMTVDEVRALEGLPPLPAAELAPVTPLFPDGDAGTNEVVNQ